MRQIDSECTGATSVGSPKEMCGVQFAQHPTQPHLIATCTLPVGHDDPHDNVLRKAGNPMSGATSVGNI